MVPSNRYKPGWREPVFMNPPSNSAGHPAATGHNKASETTEIVSEGSHTTIARCPLDTGNTFGYNFLCFSQHIQTVRCGTHQIGIFTDCQVVFQEQIKGLLIHLLQIPAHEVAEPVRGNVV